MKRSFPSRGRVRGFSLIEVLVALVVIAIGLLGIAGMQALAISNTSIARSQSIAAIEASSIAAAMQANGAYWASPGLTAAVDVTGNTLSNSTLDGLTDNCSSTSCSAQAMAAFDLKAWGQDLARNLPSGTGSVDCNSATPVTCTVKVSWAEKNVAFQNTANATTGALVSGTSSTQNYFLVVQP